MKPVENLEPFNYTIQCDFWGFRSVRAEDAFLPRCTSRPLKMGAILTFETSGCAYPLTQDHTQEEQNLRPTRI